MSTHLHTLNSSKEHHKTTELVLSLAGLYKHRHGRQKMTGLMQEEKNKHNSTRAMCCYTARFPGLPFISGSHQNIFPFLLASLEDLSMLNQLTTTGFLLSSFPSCSQSLEWFLCEFTPKLNKILSASSKFAQQHSISTGEVIHDPRLTLANSFNKRNKTGREVTEMSKYFLLLFLKHSSSF